MIFRVKDTGHFNRGEKIPRDLLPAGPFRRAVLNLKALGLIFLFLVLAAMAAVPTPVQTQSIFAATVAIVLLIAVASRPTGILQSIIVVLIFFCSGRYIIWRMTDTLMWHDPVALFCGIALLVAEIYGVIMLVLNLFVNSAPKTRDQVGLPIDPNKVPTVDVFIPTYDEAPELVEATCFAAANLNYPEGKAKVYLLDDGGTDQRINDPDTDKAEASKRRQQALQQMCESLGITYLTRPDNSHAKAGNINAALPRSSGDLILFLDADHAPTADFLEKTVGYFPINPKLVLVQTPHFFINPDPLERNLGTFGEMPSENEMFYSAIQRGMDSWGASYFCGSAAVIRRSALEEVGGIGTQTVTEDVETSIELHARGGESIFVSEPLIAGLAPETLAGFITQRTRWAQGMIQMFMLKNPLFKKGLTLSQKLCYLSSSMFWFFPIARIIFTLAPVVYYLGGVNIFDATEKEFIAYGVPHFFGTVMISIMLFGNVRWLFVSEIYELLQSTHCLKGVLGAIFSPRSPKFNVTPKAQQLTEDFISPMAWPFYLLGGVLFVTEIIGINHLIQPNAAREMSALLLFWNTFYLLLMFSILGILLERRQARRWPRMPKKLPMVLQVESAIMPVTLEDCSLMGARIRTDAALEVKLSPGKAGRLFSRSVHYDTTHSIPVTLKRIDGDGENTIAGLGVEFEFLDESDKAFASRLFYSNSYDWDDFRHSRARRGRYVQNSFYLFGKGLGGAFAHFAALFGINLARK